MKRSYTRPELVSHGRVSDLTMGANGTKPDFQLNPFQLINNNCDASDPAFACLLT